MTEPVSPDAPLPASREEMHSAMFATFVLGQSHAVLTFLGKAPHPATGKIEKDLDQAQFLIDLLEMLEAKTRGNLSREEAGLLKQSLFDLRMAFVAATETPAAAPAAPASTPAPIAEAKPAEAKPAEAAPSDDDSKKRFTKKYD